MTLNKITLSFGVLVLIATHSNFQNGVQGEALAREVNIKDDRVTGVTETLDLPEETTLQTVSRLDNNRGRAWSAWSHATSAARGRFNRKDDGPYVLEDALQN